MIHGMRVSNRAEVSRENCRYNEEVRILRLKKHTELDEIKERYQQQRIAIEREMAALKARRWSELANVEDESVRRSIMEKYQPMREELKQQLICLDEARHVQYDDFYAKFYAMQADAEARHKAELDRLATKYHDILWQAEQRRTALIDETIRKYGNADK